VKHLFFLILAVLLLTACSEDGPTDQLITIETPEGNMYAILYDETPLHKANFLKLAEAGFYDDTNFYRIIREFMIQGGDPRESELSKKDIAARDTVKYSIPAEFRPHLFHERGALAAARLGDDVNPQQASSGSQFYVVQGKVWKIEEMDQFRYDQNLMMHGMDTFLRQSENKWLLDSIQSVYQSGDMEKYIQLVYGQVDRVEQFTGFKIRKELKPERVQVYTTIGGAPHLDDTYTVFGKVIGGLEVLEKLSNVRTTPGDKPADAIPMKVRVEKVSRKKISSRFNYIYPVTATPIK